MVRDRKMKFCLNENCLSRLPWGLFRLPSPAMKGSNQSFTNTRADRGETWMWPDAVFSLDRSLWSPDGS